MFVVRVYGILIKDAHIVVSDEKINQLHVTKFPGGGLEYGEGPIDCVIREFREETGLSVSVKSHFYTTDFFQESAFRKGDQIISIYYLVETADPINIDGDKAPFSFSSEEINDFEKTKRAETLRLIPLQNLQKEDFTFPIDQVVAEMLINNKNIYQP